MFTWLLSILLLPFKATLSASNSSCFLWRLQSAEYVLHSTETVITITNDLHIAKVSDQFSSYSSYQWHLIQLIAFSYSSFLHSFLLSSLFLSFVSFLLFFLTCFYRIHNLLVFFPPLWLLIFNHLCWFIFPPLNSNGYISVLQHLPFYIGTHFLDGLVASNVTYVLMNPQFYTFKLNLSYELHSCISSTYSTF